MSYQIRERIDGHKVVVFDLEFSVNANRRYTLLFEALGFDCPTNRDVRINAKFV